MGTLRLPASAYRRHTADAIGFNLLPGPPSFVGVVGLIKNFVVNQAGMTARSRDPVRVSI